jgi:hypothetical protein
MNINYRQPNFLFAHWMFVLSLMFASFDIALVLDVAGVSLRISQLFAFLVILSGLTIITFSKRNITKPLGFWWLIGWGFFIIIFTGNTYHLEYSIGQTMFFIFTCVFLISALQIYSSSPELIFNLFKLYLISFVIISIFGLIQFFAGIFGYNLLVVQWWIPDRLPRLNGFSFEPSYFATYLITGWGMFAWLNERNVFIFSRYVSYTFFAVISLAIVLSTSRMGILIITVYALFYLVRNFWRVFVTQKISHNFFKSIIVLLFFGPLGLYIFGSNIDWSRFEFLLSGTGLAGTASHSSSIRLGTFNQTLDLFLDSPLIGYSIGGVSSYISIQTGQPPGEATGMNVSAEVLASSGIMGFPFFLLYIWTSFRSCFTPGPRVLVQECLASLGVGLALIFLILQFNQTIMRVYFWNHLCMIAILHHAFLIYKGRLGLASGSSAMRSQPSRYATMRPL